MSNKLKAAYDALNAQHDTVLEIMGRIEAHFEANEVDEALALAAELETAKAKETAIEVLYQSMVASSSKDIAAAFIPAAEKPTEEDDTVEALTRAEFDALTPQARAKHLADGGKVVDEKES